MNKHCSIFRRKNFQTISVVLTILAWFSAGLYSQDLRTSRKTGYYTYIYQLTEKEAKKVYRSNLERINSNFFHSLRDSFPTDSNYRRTLPFGHYLFMKAQDNQISFELKTISNIEVKVMNNSSDLVLSVTTLKGDAIPDARVLVNNHQLRFDETTKTYRMKHSNFKGFLSITHNGISTFYYINRLRNNSGFRRKSRKILYQSPVRYVAVPVSLVATFPLDIYKMAIHQQRRGLVYYCTQPFYDIVRTISWGEPQGFIKTVSDWFNPDFGTQGFIAFNKTIYKTGDTVKWRAYLIDKHQKPISRELQLFLQNENYTDEKLLGRIKPVRPGVYFSEFVLSDTMNLKLDKQYTLGLRSWKYYKTGTFKFEDYELKSTRYEVRTLKTTHYPNETNILYLKGTDENGLTLADTRASLAIIPEIPDMIFSDRVFLPDTLWKKEIRLDASGETAVELSSEIFPKANFNYKLTIQFLNSSNERVYREMNLQYIYHDENLAVSLTNDSVLFEKKLNGQSVNAKGNIRYYRNADMIASESVNLPYKCRINPYVTNYFLQSGIQSASKTLNTENPLVTCFSERNTDSVKFLIENPRKFPLAYFIYNLNQEVFRGNGEILSIAIPNKSEKNYYISLNYIWNNEVHTENYQVPLLTHRLNISTDQPEYIYPGKKVAIKLKVTDYKSRPVKGVDLLAYSMTSKMPGSRLPDLPDFQSKQKQRELINNFFLKQDELNNKTQTLYLEWEKWNPRMQLDSIAYYQFLHPKGGMATWCFDVNNEYHGQISPYIVMNGNIQPVYAVYINERLVFSDYTNVDLPYVFPAPEGKMTLRIRIPNAEIYVSNLFVEVGKKYIMSFENETSNHYVSITKKQYDLTSQELNIIKSSLMVVNHNSGQKDFAYVKQGNYIYPLNVKNYGYEAVTGPLSHTAFRYMVPGSFSVASDFEPQYQYEFKPGLVKMKSLPEKYYWLRNWNSPKVNFSDSLLTERYYLEQWKNSLSLQQANYPHYDNIQNTSRGFGKLRIILTDKPSRIFIKNMILFQHNQPGFIRVYGGNSEIVHQLSEGFYRAFILANDNSYMELDSLFVSRNGLTIFNLQKEWHRPDAVSESINAKIKAQYQQKSYKTVNQEKSVLRDISDTYMQSNNLTSSGSVLIEGVVTDEATGEAVPGVNVMVEGSTAGVVTDINGHYVIQVPAGSGHLVYSFVGYITEKLPIGFSNTMNVALSEDMKALEEVVVVGYGVQRKSEMTASVATVKVRGISTFEGKLAGVNASAIYGSRAPVTINSGDIFRNKALSDTTFINSLRDASVMRARFADNAFWQPALITDKNGEASFEVTFPEDMTEWKTFYAAMGNKKAGSLQSVIHAFKPMAASLAVPRFLIEGDSTEVTGKVNNYGHDTLQVVSNFAIKGQNSHEKSFSLANVHIDTLKFTAPQSDSVTIAFRIKQDKGLTDGEERTIPVLPQGTLETTGNFVTMEKDTTIRIVVPKQSEKTEIFLESNTLNIIRRQIKHVYDYPFLCNEQAASKLKCLLAEKTICSYLGENFRYNFDVHRLINKLRGSAGPDNLWGWWKDCAMNPWISVHVLEALVQAEKQGYKTDIPRQNIISSMLQKLDSYTPGEKIRILKILYQLGSKQRFDLDIKAILNENKLSAASQFEAYELLQDYGSGIPLDSLLKLKHETLYGNYYWKADSFEVASNYILTTLSMYRMLRHDSTHAEWLPKIRNFIFEERKNGNWRNTYEEANIIETLLPDLLPDGKKPEKASVSLKVGSQIKELDTFPFHMDVNGGDTTDISKKGSYPVYLSIYNRWWNRSPQKVSQGFKTDTKFSSPGNILKAGTPEKMIVKVTVLKKSTSYVMIEIPIPAGCSYDEKRQYAGFETHREYYKDKVCIFCDCLPEGEHIYEIELLPRYNGKYTLNPARAELMYFPVFFGRNAVKKVEVK